MRVLWEPKVSRIEQIRELVDEHGLAYYATASTWWTIRSDDVAENLGRMGRPDDLPCDPQGSVLMQGPASEFLDAAEQNADHYGPLGLVAFCAAFHGNLILPDRRPWSLKGWPLVTAVIRRSLWQARLVVSASRYEEVNREPPYGLIAELKAGDAW